LHRKIQLNKKNQNIFLYDPYIVSLSLYDFIIYCLHTMVSVTNRKLSSVIYFYFTKFTKLR